MYIVFVVIPRVPSDEGYSFSRKSGVYRDDIAVFRTSNEEVAKAVAELLTKDYEDGPGEDYPEGFIFKSETKMSLKDRLRVKEQLANPEDWALRTQKMAEEYASELSSLISGDEESCQPTVEGNGKDAGYCFRLRGMWELRFKDEEGHFPALKGFSILHTLLRDSSRARQISAMTLAGQDVESTKVTHFFQATLDKKAMSDYMARIEELEHLISAAGENSPSAEIEKYQTEMEFLYEELARAKGFGDRPRELGPKSPRKRAQVSVKQAIKRTFEAIEKDMPKLAAYLHDHITTGHSCYYAHDNSFEWQL